MKRKLSHDHRVSRLPRWAQDGIRSLEREVEELTEVWKEVTPKESQIFLYKGGNIVRYKPMADKDSIRLFERPVSTEVVEDVRLEDDLPDAINVSFSRYDNAFKISSSRIWGTTLSLEPGGSNSFAVRLRRR